MPSYELAQQYANSGKKPTQIAEELGVLVLYTPMELMKGIVFSAGQQKLIIINSLLEDVEKEFICSHEIGHLHLHPTHNFFKILDHTYFYTKGEYQANRFACEMMIGEKAEQYFTTISETASRGRLQELVKLILDFKREKDDYYDYVDIP